MEAYHHDHLKQPSDRTKYIGMCLFRAFHQLNTFITPPLVDSHFQNTYTCLVWRRSSMLTNSCSVFFGIGLDNNNFFVLNTTSTGFSLCHLSRLPIYKQPFWGGGGMPPPILRFIRKLESEMPATRNLWHSR